MEIRRKKAEVDSRAAAGETGAPETSESTSTSPLRPLDDADIEISFELILEKIQSAKFYRFQKNRFFVALSLEEAEHLRAATHLLFDNLREATLHALNNSNSSPSGKKKSSLASSPANTSRTPPTVSGGLGAASVHALERFFVDPQHQATTTEQDKKKKMYQFLKLLDSSVWQLLVIPNTSTNLGALSMDTSFVSNRCVDVCSKYLERVDESVAESLVNAPGMIGNGAAAAYSPLVDGIGHLARKQIFVSPFQATSSEQLFRFFDSQHAFTDSQINFCLRNLSGDEVVEKTSAGRTSVVGGWFSSQEEKSGRSTGAEDANLREVRRNRNDDVPAHLQLDTDSPLKISGLDNAPDILAGML